MLFDVMLHLGTVIAIVVAYWVDIKYIVRDSLAFLRDSRGTSAESLRDYSGARFLLMLIFGSLPLFLVLPVNDSIEQLYYFTGFIGAAFLLTGCMLWVSDRIAPGEKTERNMRVRDALLIGVCQAIATIPGISRSGATITAGIATGQSREYAMKYSLLMSVPAVLGANFLSLIKALKNGAEWSSLPVYFVGMVVAMVSGYGCIMLLQRMVRNGKFGKFAYYLWGVGILTLILSLF